MSLLVQRMLSQNRTGSVCEANPSWVEDMLRQSCHPHERLEPATEQADDLDRQIVSPLPTRAEHSAVATLLLFAQLF